MTSEGLETEKKYDVDTDTALPALHEIPGVERVGEPSDADLEAVYFDTDDFILAARRITLRRRTGGVDAGWHLKLPAESDTESAPESGTDSGAEQAPRQRREIHAPLGQAAVVPGEYSPSGRQAFDDLQAARLGSCGSHLAQRVAHLDADAVVAEANVHLQGRRRVEYRIRDEFAGDDRERVERRLHGQLLL